MVCYSGRLISVMSHCDVYHGLCYNSDIHQGLCHIVIFVKGYVTLSYLSRVMSHCDVYQGLRFTMTLLRVYHITMLSHGLLQWAFNKRYVALSRLSRVMLH